jgi:hypothetical protein
MDSPGTQFCIVHECRSPGCRGPASDTPIGLYLTTTGGTTTATTGTFGSGLGTDIDGNGSSKATSSIARIHGTISGSHFCKERHACAENTCPRERSSHGGPWCDAHAADALRRLDEAERRFGRLFSPGGGQEHQQTSTSTPSPTSSPSSSFFQFISSRPLNDAEEALKKRLADERERLRDAERLRDGDYNSRLGGARGRRPRRRCGGARRECSLDSGIGGSPSVSSSLTDEAYTTVG